jgi:hypothetical protein
MCSLLSRYGPVLRIGFLMWSLGTGLKLIFSRSTPLPVYAVVLAIEGVGVGFVHQPGLVALQALSRTEDRAVATSTRNLLRSLGGVAGVAISTAVHYETTLSRLKSSIPSEYVDKVMSGEWHKDDMQPADYETVMDAQMRGFRVVFAMLVPLITLCFAGSFLVTDKQLQGDKNEDEMPPPRTARPVKG